MYESLLFLIDGGRAMSLVLEHLQEMKHAEDLSLALAQELGVERVTVNGMDGAVMAVQFDDVPHPDFEPGECGWVPRRGTPWSAKFRAQKGYRSPSHLIAHAFGMPLSITYRSGVSWDSRTIAFPLTDCGFFYHSETGPFAMWVPDIPAEVAALEARGYSVDEPAGSFQMLFDSCRRIEMHDWELLVTDLGRAVSPEEAEEAALQDA